MELRPEYIIRMGVELEKQGIAFYKDLQRHFPADSDLFKILEFLRLEEERHLEFFQEMDRKYRAGHEAAAVFSEAQAVKIREFVDEKIFGLTRQKREQVISENSLDHLILFAAQTEIDTARYYKGMTGYLPVENRAIMQKMVLEESSHLEVLLDLLSKVRTRRGTDEKGVMPALSGTSISNYRDRELSDLSVLNKVLQSLIERSETDVVTLVSDSLAGLLQNVSPEMWMLFIYERNGEKCSLKHAAWRSTQKSLSGQFSVALSSLLVHLAVGKKEAYIIPDTKRLDQFRDAWDLKFCRDSGVIPRNVVILPLSNVGAIEIVNVREDFDLALINTLMLNIVAGIIHILFLEKEGLDRIGEFYRFLAFISEDVKIEEIYQKALKLIAQEIGAGHATILHLSGDRNKIFVAEGVNYLFQEIQFVPFPAKGSFVSQFSETVSVLIGREKAVERSRPEIGVVEKASQSEVFNYLVAPLMTEKGIEGEVLVCNKRGGFRPQDVDFLDFIAKELASILTKRRQMKEMSKMQKEGAFLSRYFSPNLLKRLKKGEEIQKGGIEEDVVILFADIRGFTTLSERMSPRAVVELLNTYFGRVVNIVLQNDGVIDKFIGDAVFVYWGVPVKHKNDTLLAALTAIAMQEEITFMKSKKILPEEFHVGIGINKGQAILGNIGSEERMEFTAIGDTVNVASRLCGIAPADQIIVSGSVYKEIFFDLEVEPFGKKFLTGKTQEVLTYRVVSLKQDFFDIYIKAF
jgi:class 3 adenylate cyclase/rubrerythrin